MAEEHQHQKSHEHEPTVGTEGAVERKDRGLFDFLGKKEEEKPQHHKDQEQVIATEFEKVHVSEPKIEEEHKVHVSEPKVEEHKGEEKEKKPGLLEKLHRSDSSSSCSSDEKEDDDEETKKKKREKKGLKEKLKEKISGDKEEKHEETTVPVEKVDEVPHQVNHEEKKGFLDKIKDKLPGHHKKPEDQAAASPPPTPATHQAEHVTTEEHNSHEGEEAKEKKGILEKLKEKIPGYHPKTEEEKEKEKEKESASH